MRDGIRFFASICVMVLAMTGLVPDAQARMKIGMVVLIGCEDVCRGVKDYIAEREIDADVVVYDRDQMSGDISEIVAKMRAAHVDLAITWGTKVTLGVLGKLEDRQSSVYLNEIPVVFTVVADPVGSGIIESYDPTGRDNVTGTRNRVPENVNINSIRRYLPGFDHLGILYDPTAPNSMLKVDEIKALQDPLGFKLDAVALDLLPDGTPDPASIATGVSVLKEKGVQFIYLGSSAFLEKQSDLFTGVAVEAGIPVLTPYEHMVTKSNALMSVAARDYDVGKLAGQQVEKILVGKKRAGDLPVLAMNEFAYIVNMKVARSLDLYPPIEFLQFVEKVE